MEPSPVAIITGAGRGIGRAAAIELAGRGYRTVLVSRTESDLRETSRAAPHSIVIPADVRRPEECRRVVAGAVMALARLDAVVNCAGIAPALSVEKTSDEIWRDVIDSNLSATFYMCREAWEVFTKQGRGVIVNLSSFAARDPFPGFHAYGAAKAGVNLLGMSLAREGAPLGIRVHTVAPAAVETGMLRTILSKDQYPTEKCLAPADVARIIAQCVAGDLRHTSGEVIYVHKSP